MGHLAIVNQDTLEDVVSSGCISTRGVLKKMWVKTAADLFSDVLATRAGHPVFPWCIGSPQTENIGFNYVFEVAGSPFYVPGDEFPIKVPLKNVGLRYDRPVSEAEALDLWGRKLLWNAIGKKSLGRGRSITHQMPMEDVRLMEMLNAGNTCEPSTVPLGRIKKRGIPITIDPSQDDTDTKSLRRMESTSEWERISRLKLKKIPWRSGDRFRVEKALEAWIMENIDKSPNGDSFRELVLEPGRKMDWFGNYLPFGVAGSNMDIVVVQDAEEGKIVTTIELKAGQLDEAGFRDAVEQVRAYSGFLRRAFEAYGIHIVTREIVIAARASRPPASPGTTWKKTRLVTYSIDDSGQVVFR